MLTIALLLLTSCNYQDGYQFAPGPDPNNPGIVHLGEVVIEDLDNYSGGAYYGSLGTVEPGQTGGATATFVGTGGNVCVWVDPEAVYWTQAIAVQNKQGKFAYPDNYYDDGDIDLEVGLSAFYTGSPGVEMGDFQAIYEDSLGNESYIEFNECTITDWYGLSGSHAGRGTIEYCTIDTSAHPGKEYTVVLNTWSLPLDDYSLSYALMLFEGDCSDVQGRFKVTSPYGTSVTVSASSPAGECLLLNEAGDADFAELELAYCAEEQTYYCCVQNPDNPSCSDEDINEDTCPPGFIEDF